MSRKAVVLGATGLVGTQLVSVLIGSEKYDEIILINRRKQNYQSEKIIQIIEDDFQHLEQHQNRLDGHDFYCALGTTKAKAGSKQAFKKVDHDYPLLFAKIAVQSPNFFQVGIVSALGADSSSIIFYNKIKGEVEDELKNMNIDRLHIFQPNLLLGDRAEFRFGELVMKYASKFFSFLLFRPHNPLFAIEASTVAKAMLKASNQVAKGTFVYKPGEIKKLAK